MMAAAATPQTLGLTRQDREDLYLWALVGDRTPGTYVDVGCYDERLHSVTRLFYEHGWSGLNIDANDGFRPGYAMARARPISSAPASAASLVS